MNKEFKEFGIIVIGDDKTKADNQAYHSIIQGIFNPKIGEDKNFIIKKNSLKIIPYEKDGETGWQYTIWVAEVE